MNARFWVQNADDFVKLTLRPGQSLSHSQGRPTDEGWASLARTWSYDLPEFLVRCEYVDDEVDCDGRLTRGVELECPLHRLEALTFNATPPLPFWEKRAPSWQRDYQAEVAGY